jgi:hypothetical protein
MLNRRGAGPSQTVKLWLSNQKEHSLIGLFEPTAFIGNPQSAEEIVATAPVSEDFSSLNAPAQHVMQRPGLVNPWLPGHSRMRSLQFSCVKLL